MKLIKTTSYYMLGSKQGVCSVTSTGLHAYSPFLWDPKKYFRNYRAESNDYEAIPVSRFTCWKLAK